MPGGPECEGRDTGQLDEEVLVVEGVRLEGDPWDRVALNGLRLLHDSGAGAVHFC